MKIAGYVLLLVVIALGGSMLWLERRDPMDLPQPEHNLTAEDIPLLPLNKRHIEHITLHSTQLGDIGFVISLPDPMPKEKLPVLIVLGGLGTGENNIRYITDAGHNAIIGYDWPMPVRFYSGPAFITQMPELYSRLMTIPGQIASSVEWLAQQSWADSAHISLLGFSLGALAAPSAQDVTQQDGGKIGWTIIAYGGAPFGELFETNPHIKPAAMRYILAPVIDLLLKPLQPTQHLPHLSGHFLVLQGKNDGLIPEEARTTLREAVPEPKKIITFEGDHMGVGQNKMELLQKIMDASKAWLIENGAVNPT